MLKSQATELNTLCSNIPGISVLIPYADGSLIAGCFDGSIQLLSCKSEPKKELKEHTDSIISLAVFRTNWLISASLDKTIKIWDTDGNCKQTIQMPRAIARLAAAKNQKWFAATLTIHQNATFSVVYIWSGDGPGRSLPILAKRYSPLVATDNKLIFIDINSNIVVYDIQAKDIAYTIKLQGFNPLNYISCQPKTAGSFTNICVYNNYLVYGINSSSKTSTLAGQIEHKACNIYFVDLNTKKNVKSYKLSGYHLESLISHNLGAIGILQAQPNKKCYQNFDLQNCSHRQELTVCYDDSIAPVPFGVDGIACAVHNGGNSDIYTLKVYQDVSSTKSRTPSQPTPTDKIFQL